MTILNDILCIGSSSSKSFDESSKKKKPQSKNNGGTLFWQGLLLYLKNGKSCSANCGVNAIIKFIQDSMIPVGGDVESNLTLSTAIVMMAVELDSEFAGLIIGKLSILVEKVLEFDDSLSDAGSTTWSISIRDTKVLAN